MDEKEKKEEQEDLAEQWASILQQENKEEKKEEQEDLAEQWASMLQQENKEEFVVKETAKPGINPEILKKLDILLDLPVNITVEVGSKILSIEEILKLTPNSVIDLDRYLNEPIDLKVNGVLIAKGELYQVEDNFAIKIIEILTREERLNLLSKQVGK